MGDYLIRRLTNQESQFYPLVGPFLASRQVVKELSIPAWDDPDKIWFVAIRDGQLCGFVAALHQSSGVVFCSDYVVPEHRDTGVYSALSTARMQEYVNAPVITATVASAAVDVYARHGFAAVGNRGRFTAMRRER